MKQNGLNSKSSDSSLYEDNSRPNNHVVGVVFGFITLCLLGLNFSAIGNGYFVSVSIFSIPTIFELTMHKPRSIMRIIIRNIHILLLMVICIICILGLIGVLNIVSIDGTPNIMVQEDFVLGGEYHVPAFHLWLAVVASWFCSLVDLFASKTRAEDKMKKAGEQSGSK